MYEIFKSYVYSFHTVISIPFKKFTWVVFFFKRWKLTVNFDYLFFSTNKGSFVLKIQYFLLKDDPNLFLLIPGNPAHMLFPEPWSLRDYNWMSFLRRFYSAYLFSKSANAIFIILMDCSFSIDDFENRFLKNYSITTTTNVVKIRQ